MNSEIDKDTNHPRKPLLAFLSALFFPGFGQVYNGPPLPHEIEDSGEFILSCGKQRGISLSAGQVCSCELTLIFIYAN